MTQFFFFLQGWRYWMFELLSIACLSVASKFHETSPPQLLELQVYSPPLFSKICLFNKIILNKFHTNKNYTI